jgi:hypothetical protein
MVNISAVTMITEKMIARTIIGWLSISGTNGGNGIPLSPINRK